LKVFAVLKTTKKRAIEDIEAQRENGPVPPDGTDKIPHILTLARPHIVWGSRGNWGATYDYPWYKTPGL